MKSLDPNSVKALADSSYRNKDYIQAESLYKQAISTCEIESKSVSAVLHLNLALCFFHQARFLECVEACSTALELTPGYMKARFRRALAYEQLDRFEEALSDLKAVCETPGLRAEAEDGIRRCIHKGKLRENEGKTVLEAQETFIRSASHSSSDCHTAGLTFAKAFLSYYNTDRKGAISLAISTLKSLRTNPGASAYADFLLSIGRSGLDLEGAGDTELMEMMRIEGEDGDRVTQVALMMYDRRSNGQTQCMVSQLCDMVRDMGGRCLQAIRGLLTVCGKSELTVTQWTMVLGTVNVDALGSITFPHDSPERKPTEAAVVQLLRTNVTLVSEAFINLAIPIPMQEPGHFLLFWALSVISPAAVLKCIALTDIVRACEETDLSCAVKADFFLDTLRNLMCSKEFRPVVQPILDFIGRNRGNIIRNNPGTEAKLYALLATGRILEPGKCADSCELPRVLELLQTDLETAMDILCMLAFSATNKRSIAQALPQILASVSVQSYLIPLTTLLRNLALSNQDKALVSAPSEYSETDLKQTQELLQLAGQPSLSPSIDFGDAEQSGIVKQLILVSDVLPTVMKQCRKERRNLSSTFMKTVTELIYAMAEVKESRSVFVSQEGVDFLLNCGRDASQSIAGHAVARLLLTTNPALLPQVQLQDAVSLIQKTLTSSKHELVDFECGLALVNLSGFHADLRDQMIGLQTHRSAVELISSENPMIRKMGLELACNLVASEKIETEFAKNRSLDLIQIFLALVDGPDEELSFLSLGALANTVHIPKVRSLLTSPENLGFRLKFDTVDRSHPNSPWKERLAVVRTALESASSIA